MIEHRTDFVTAPGAWATALVVASALVALAGCDQFDSEKLVDACVASAMRHGEPFGNARERSESQTQFRQYCAAAVARKHL